MSVTKNIHFFIKMSICLSIGVSVSANQKNASFVPLAEWNKIMHGYDHSTDREKNKFIFDKMESKVWVERYAVLDFMLKNNFKNALFEQKVLELFTNDPALVVRTQALKVLDRMYPKMESQSYRNILWEEFFDSNNKKKSYSLWIRDKILNSLSSHTGYLSVDEKKKWLRALQEDEVRIQKAAVNALEKRAPLGTVNKDDKLELKQLLLSQFLNQ